MTVVRACQSSVKQELQLSWQSVFILMKIFSSHAWGSLGHHCLFAVGVSAPDIPLCSASDFVPMVLREAAIVVYL